MSVCMERNTSNDVNDEKLVVAVGLCPKINDFDIIIL